MSRREVWTAQPGRCFEDIDRDGHLPDARLVVPLEPHREFPAPVGACGRGRVAVPAGTGSAAP